ncbi:MAG: hypothetical protein K2M06_03205 [Muribaculaceae bacterium]|nr:hypothetical protein [Muribaculaceae bacterium]
MKRSIQLLLLLSLVLSSPGCKNAIPQADTETPEIHEECNGIYYWKTVLDPYSTELEFLDKHDVGRLYLRMFDVVAADSLLYPNEGAIPNASLRFTEKYGNYKLNKILENKTVEPVVYITLEALKASSGKEEDLARKIYIRVRNMCQYNEFHDRVAGLQLDCDWTKSMERSYFELCRKMREILNVEEPSWKLSSTIRLHQLSREAPPVDYGVLMVYNTGNFQNPDANNSIIDTKDVAPYLKHLDTYPLHLDVSYPTYSWQLLFRERHFMGLLNGVETDDTSRFRQKRENVAECLRTTPYGDRLLLKGDLVRTESSPYPELAKVKQMIEKKLSGRPHSTILYHLDSLNLSKYTEDEISELYKSGNRD